MFVLTTYFRNALPQPHVLVPLILSLIGISRQSINMYILVISLIASKAIILTIILAPVTNAPTEFQDLQNVQHEGMRAE